jgi:hypothetical protein
MAADAHVGYDELLAEIRRLCTERRTGTLFIATGDNEGGQLGLRDGVIVAARFRRATGLDAVHAIRKIRSARFTFARDVVEPADPRRSLSSAAALAVLTDAEAPRALPQDDGALRDVLTTALTEYLGPMAAVVVREQLAEAQRAGRSTAEVVEALARGIDEPAAAGAFRANVAAALAARRR